jgi:hypothetical protein
MLYRVVNVLSYYFSDQFIMSEKVTDGKHITLTLPHTENDCFLLYVSLCEKCVLTIPELNRIYNSTNDQSVLNSWQVYQLEIETGLEHLRFYKTTTDNSTLGYWGIDLHECPTNDIGKLYELHSYLLQDDKIVFYRERFLASKC